MNRNNIIDIHRRVTSSHNQRHGDRSHAPVDYEEFAEAFETDILELLEEVRRLEDLLQQSRNTRLKPARSDVYEDVKDVLQGYGIGDKLRVVMNELDEWVEWRG